MDTDCINKVCHTDRCIHRLMPLAGQPIWWRFWDWECHRSSGGILARMHSACENQGRKEPFPQGSATSSESRDPPDNGLCRGEDHIRQYISIPSTAKCVEPWWHGACVWSIRKCFAASHPAHVWLHCFSYSRGSILPESNLIVGTYSSSSHYIIFQSIYCRLMLELASFIVLQRQPRRTISNRLASISIPASMSRRSMTFCIYSNTYIRWW